MTATALRLVEGHIPVELVAECLVYKRRPLLMKKIAVVVALFVFITTGASLVVTGSLFALWANSPYGRCKPIPNRYLNEEMAKTIVPFDDQDFGKLSINHLQYLGTHNSFRVAMEIPYIAKFGYSHDKLTFQANYGVRHYELDSHYDSHNKRWVVYHLAVIDDRSNCGDCLSDCLSELKTWSDNNKNHTVMIIYLEPKTKLNARPYCISKDDGNIFLRKESEVLSVFPLQQIIVPDQIKGNYSTLSQAVINRGWPSVESTRGKFLFVMNLWSENMHCKQYYKDKKHPLFFMRTSTPDDPHAAFFEMPSHGNKEVIKNHLSKNFFVRTGVVTKSMIRSSVDYGAQLLSVDFLDSNLPRTTRCNPVNSPANCTLSNA
ncbi:hypothetical protein AKO1_009654 [Acrasis kona]|uniref:Uncharacterized protein n=1 Tax=Acrasis kona TaxID=1008807 RepID=A0AAW2ZN77_9EUKA